MGIQLPDAASQERTRAVVKKVSAILKKTPGVRGWFLIGGQSLLDQTVGIERGDHVPGLRAVSRPEPAIPRRAWRRSWVTS